MQPLPPDNNFATEEPIDMSITMCYKPFHAVLQKGYYQTDNQVYAVQGSIGA